MYSTCLFCNSDLGRNEVVENFPVGRRLAFDAAKGRLWVVCRRCERWNLTPLEDRWEAIEECERSFRGTTLRLSTDEIGLARLREGLELVRIGAPQRPEMAAWRYGDQFGRRRRKDAWFVAASLAAGGIAVVAGPMMGLFSLGAVGPLTNLFNLGLALRRSTSLIHVPDPVGGTFRIRLVDLDKVSFGIDGGELLLHVPAARARDARSGSSSVPWYRYDRGESRELRGDAVIHAAGAILPRLNRSGGSKGDVQRAVAMLEETSSTKKLFFDSADSIANRGLWTRLALGHEHLLSNMPAAGRLALEMAAHEDSERRAMEGELHLLEAAWRDAEEIAHIADGLLLPPSVTDDLARLKRSHDPDRHGDASR